MDQESEQGRPHDDPRRLGSDRPQNAINNGIKHPGISHHSEKQDSEHKHADHRSQTLQSRDDEFPRVPAKPADQCGSHRDQDERHQRRDPLHHDDHQQSDNCYQT